MNRNDLIFSLREGIDQELDAIVEAADINFINRLQAEVDSNPRYPDVRHRLAQLCHLAGRCDDALVQLDAALALNPKFVDALRLKSTVLANQGKMHDALLVCEQVRELVPHDAEAYYRLAVVLSRLGRRAEAIANSRRAVELNRGHELAHVLLAEQLMFEQDCAGAIAHFEAANSLRPHEQYAYLLGLLHLKLNHPQQGEAFLEQSLQLRPNHLNSCVRLAVVKIAGGDYERAYTLLRLAVGFYPNYPDLHFALAKVCLLIGRRDEAYEMMNAALEINPRYAEARREMGYLHSARNQHADAVAALRESLDIDPDDVQAYANLGFVFSNQGEFNRAVEVLENAIRRFPDSWQLLHNLGIVHLQERVFPKAKRLFALAVSVNPELEALHRSLRIAFQDESLLDEERERLLAGHTQPEQKSELDHRLGVVHLEFHKEKPAIGYLLSSMAAGYEPELNCLLLATIYANMQNFDFAVRTLKDFDGASLMGNVQAILMGLFLANAGDHEHASRHYQRVMTDSPLLFHSLNAVPICFREREELDDILDDYQDYARFHVRSAELYCRIGEIHAQKGMLIEAWQHFHHATVLDPDIAKVHHSLGVLALLRIDLSAAVGHFLRAVEKTSEWSIPHLNLALIYLAQGKQTLASVSLRRYASLEPDDGWREQAHWLLEKTRTSAPPVQTQMPHIYNPSDVPAGELPAQDSAAASAASLPAPR